MKKPPKCVWVIFDTESGKHAHYYQCFTRKDAVALRNRLHHGTRRRAVKVLKYEII